MTSHDTVTTESAPRAIAYAGYPGAGKTEAATYGLDWVGGEHVSMGQAVKEVALDELGPDATSHEIGHWATVSREVSGPDVMARRIVRKWQEGGPPREPVHIEGVRSIHEVRAFQEMFGYVPILFIDAPFQTRLDRLQERGRDGEADFGETDLLERDGREAEWGMADLDVLAQHRVPNEDSLVVLKNRVGSRLMNVLGLPRDE